MKASETLLLHVLTLFLVAFLIVQFRPADPAPVNDTPITAECFRLQRENQKLSATLDEAAQVMELEKKVIEGQQAVIAEQQKKLKRLQPDI